MIALRRHPSTRTLAGLLIAALTAAMAPREAWASRAVEPPTVTIHADGIGSIRALTDETGAVTDRYTYTAFGELLSHTGPDPQPYAFASEPYDANAGFQYHRARWMDPRVRRFLGMDPFGGRSDDPPSLHRYMYARLNPIVWIDPSGLSSASLLGTLIHQDIVRMYPNPSALLGNKMIPGFPERLFPDIADLEAKEVIEIKPLSMRWGMTGWLQVRGYALALDFVGRFLPGIGTGWHEGSWTPDIGVYNEPTTNTPYIVYGNALGVIFYYYPERKISDRTWNRLAEKAAEFARVARERAEQEIAKLAAEMQALSLQDQADLAVALAGAAAIVTMAAISMQVSTKFMTRSPI